MYAQAAIKPNTSLRNGAYGIVMRGVQKCTCAGASLRDRNSAPLCCIKLDTATDPACGSAGFTVHTIFHVAGKKFTAEGLPPHIVEYAGERVFGIDTSPRSVKISKSINLIAGDGKTNIYELNSLESDKWDETGKAGFRDMLTYFDDPIENDNNQK